MLHHEDVHEYYIRKSIRIHQSLMNKFVNMHQKISDVQSRLPVTNLEILRTINSLEAFDLTFT